MEFKHINQIVTAAENCKTEEELEKLFGEIPSKFGTFYFERQDEDTVTIYNNYYDTQMGDYVEDSWDVDMPEIKEEEI